ncbi:hypothetical protein VTP01DRAFT_10528 [Rhizomucor pusillus]|uniref:uncharacterized protein n=1 Tax=Rhizomucor pusillus TaxID=4840 RepID=UPI00374430CB
MELVTQVCHTQFIPLLSKLTGSQAYALARKNEALSIGTAVALTAVYMAYSTVTKTPKNFTIFLWRTISRFSGPTSVNG